ncbi:MAG: 2Fe-2S iron-sulfur cluster-binding protein [Pyrinomonadaceae bacterium]
MQQDDLFEPFEKLIELKINGKSFQVPENNTLLRCFQYISVESISYGDFCWNGDCLNCRVWVRTGDKEKMLMSCRAIVEEGMEIIRINEEVLINLPQQ